MNDSTSIAFFGFGNRAKKYVPLIQRVSDYTITGFYRRNKLGGKSDEKEYGIKFYEDINFIKCKPVLSALVFGVFRRCSNDKMG